jgi:3-hydroxyisobutyrate dehydrogenase-like beta-hydroxyacid dehydrogenase
VTTTDYGFIGVGRMGGLMARRLLDQGLTLTVYDTAHKAVDELVAAGARAAGSAPEVCSKSKIVFLSLPMPAIVESVCLDAGGVQDGSMVKYIVDC